jgi:hypothetical protein
MILPTSATLDNMWTSDSAGNLSHIRLPLPESRRYDGLRVVMPSDRHQRRLPRSVARAMATLV